MKQKDRKLLLKDLSARLCYGVKVSLEYEGESLVGTLDAVYPSEDRVIVDNLSKAIAPINVRCGGFKLKENVVRPYLRSMSSMTEDEMEECGDMIYADKDNDLPLHLLDWLLSHHFDFRGLIPLGLALEATSEIYPSNIV